MTVGRIDHPLTSSTGPSHQGVPQGIAPHHPAFIPPPPQAPRQQPITDTPAFGQTQPTFAGGKTAIAEKAAEAVLHRKYAGWGTKAINKMLELQQGVHGNAASMFLIDTMTVWAPKIVVSRSLPEAAEMTFLEFVESGLFYFVPGILAGGIAGRGGLYKLFMNLVPKGRRFDVKHLAGDLAKMSPKLAQRVAPVKMAVILSSLAGAFAGEYALSFIKNLLTEKVFHVTDFSNIASLNKNKNAAQTNRKAVNEKAYRRIGQCAIGAAAALLASVAMVRFGFKSDRAMKIAKTVGKYLDFSYGKNGKGGLTFGLGAGQIPVVIYAGAISYTDAARDALEKIEVAIRANVTAWYLAFGSHWLKRGMLRQFDKSKAFQNTTVIQKVDNPTTQWAGELTGKFIGLFNKGAGQRWKNYFTSEREIMSLVDGNKQALGQAAEWLTKQGVKNPSTETLEKTAWSLFRQKTLGQQQLLYYLPKLFGAVVVSFGIALFSRIMTAQRYNRWKAQGHEYFENRPRKAQNTATGSSAPALEASTQTVPEATYPTTTTAPARASIPSSIPTQGSWQPDLITAATRMTPPPPILQQSWQMVAPTLSQQSQLSAYAATAAGTPYAYAYNNQATAAHY
ncbi:MAG: hypothetical protein KC476_05255 [Cyanobacteria bacterium HKST-UBA06]|nr:hypothetical protein [Cyanobacteria bacterium HKST-UBA06]